MKVVVIKNNLKKALEAVVKITGEKTTLPVLKNILIKAENNNLILSATNLELAVSYKCSAKIIEPGEITVSALVLSSIINNLTSEVVNLSLKNNNLTLSTDNYEALLNTLPVDDFPIIPNLKNKNINISFSPDLFKKSLQQVLLATQFSDLRPELNGILLLIDGKKIFLVGTDSFRLAEKIINPKKINLPEESNLSFIIPLQTINEFIRIFPNEKEINIYFEDNQILIESEQISIISRLIDGNFPDYKQIIPINFIIESLVDREEIINALKVTSVLSGKINSVTIGIKEKFLTLKSANQGLGENKYILPGKIKGEDMEVDFNTKYFLDGLKSLDTEKIVLNFNKSDKPTLIKNADDDSFTYILMPVRE